MPLDATALALASLRELGAAIRAGDTSPTALAKHSLERLDTVGRRFHAVVTLTPDRALREARRAEEELAAGHDRGPLHGIPYGLKDLVATANIPTTFGAAPFKDQVFPRDATIARRLEEAGAVLVAKLGMVELAGGMGYDQPNASLTGPGLSPWNPDGWSGGSSSGSGSAVGARAVPFAIGSETWGSIVTPSSFCGVSGLRPTYGRVSRHGAMALCWTLDKLGPMCRSADDCGLVLDAIAGPDPEDETSLDWPYSYRPEAERHDGFRLAVLADGAAGTQPEVSANFEAALTVLRGVSTVEQITLPEAPYDSVAMTIIRAEAASAFDDFLLGGGASGLAAPEDRINPLAYSALPARDYLRALRIRRRLQRELDGLLARFDAIVAPGTRTVAGPISEPFSKSLRRAAGDGLGAAGNLAGLPAVCVPNGFGERGLPTSIQFVGRAGAENVVLAVAHAYQQRTDWHRRLPPEVV